MNYSAEHTDWSKLTSDEKTLQLFLNQKKTLAFFLESGAISRAQYDKSLGDLREKMEIDIQTE